MSELDNFISSLSDHEFAIFFGYRYDKFLENSKKKIDKEIRKRNLSYWFNNRVNKSRISAVIKNGVQYP